MKEIKFRGKPTNNNTTYFEDNEFVYGSLVIDNNKYYIVLGINDNIDRDDYEVYMVEVIPETVGQYTGLKDKNGKEIYKGDILRFPAKSEWEKNNYISYECWFDDRDTFKYGWHFGRARFYGCICGGDSGVPMEWAKQLEVIGNIYDNLELLKEEY